MTGVSALGRTVEGGENLPSGSGGELEAHEGGEIF